MQSVPPCIKDCEVHPGSKPLTAGLCRFVPAELSPAVVLAPATKITIKTGSCAVITSSAGKQLLNCTAPETTYEQVSPAMPAKPRSRALSCKVAVAMGSYTYHQR